MSDPYDLEAARAHAGLWAEMSRRDLVDGWREALDEIERLAQDRAGWVSTALDLDAEIAGLRDSGQQAREQRDHWAAESKRQAAVLDRCRALLQRVEVPNVREERNDPDLFHCMNCHWDNGHAPDCELAALLGKP